jgi:hypothetical protein
MIRREDDPGAARPRGLLSGTQSHGPASIQQSAGAQP